ncbi:CapA family protein [Neobacillus sp. LXY-4]|uniref:CapA family protein n=1 Tax=Neobacillus sp. LXY-4 TaxID=3379826 RepID=UPI003EE19CF8
MLMNAWTKDIIEEVLDGTWFIEPSLDWYATNVGVVQNHCQRERTLFIAIDKETWLAGTGNKGHYAVWEDTHELIHQFTTNICGVICQRPIENLPPHIPQFLVKNSYSVIKQLALKARQKTRAKVIAVTGVVGKTSTTNMIGHILETNHQVEKTLGNHNSRTGVALTLARSITDPDFIVIETALSALWMKSGSISLLSRPHIVVITEVSLGQTNNDVKTAKDTAIMKAKIAQGIEVNGIAVINRDMNEYELVKNEVEKYGATVVSYGFHKDADNQIIDHTYTSEGSRITAKINGEIVHYYLPLLGRGMAQNSLAALTVADLLGLTIETTSHALLTFPKKPKVLDLKTLTVGKIPIHVLDDSYNAEVSSVKSAVEVYQQLAPSYSGRKIALLGAIVNLKENSEWVHRELGEWFASQDFDKVFAHGHDMKYFMENISAEQIGGVYLDAKSCAEALRNYIQKDDFLLFKGSQRGSDFGQTLDKLQTHSFEKIDPLSFHAKAINLTNGELLFEAGSSSVKQHFGLGHVLFLTSLLRKISLKKLVLTDKVTISNKTAAESKGDQEFHLKGGETVSVLKLLHGFIFKNSPSAILALADFLDSERVEALRAIRQKVQQLDLKKEVAINVTGRVLKKKPQAYDLNDLIKVGQDLFSLSFEELKYLSSPFFEFRDRVIDHKSVLLSNGKAYAAYMFGENHSEGLVLTFINQKPVMLAITGARDEFHRDFVLTNLIDRIQNKEKGQTDLTAAKEIIQSQKEEVTINLLGDTYFGEDYTRKRTKQGKEDALTKFGYDYSFQKLAPLFLNGDVNIVNFEAVCIESGTRSPYEGIKPYLLWAEGEPSIKALKAVNVHAVSLGNNHAMDYEEAGLLTTLAAFLKENVTTFGAGRNADEAGQPLKVSIHDSSVYIFNAYWFRKTAYRSFESYACGDKSGVASLSGDILDRIKAIKQKEPNSFIVVQPHWGVDFLKTNPLQRKYAEQLIDAGCDLIVGHGPHTLQEIRKYKGKWIIFSVGNGVFNSNGEYAKYNAPPYGFLTQLIVNRKAGISVKLFPFFANNLKTFWQPHFVDDHQFLEVQKFLEQEKSDIEEMSILDNEFGKHFTFEC